MNKLYIKPKIKVVMTEVENGFAASGFANDPEVVHDLELTCPEEYGDKGNLWGVGEDADGAEGW